MTEYSSQSSTLEKISDLFINITNTKSDRESFIQKSALPLYLLMDKQNLSPNALICSKNVGKVRRFDYASLFETNMINLLQEIDPNLQDYLQLLVQDKKHLRLINSGKSSIVINHNYYPGEVSKVNEISCLFTDAESRLRSADCNIIINDTEIKLLSLYCEVGLTIQKFIMLKELRSFLSKVPEQMVIAADFNLNAYYSKPGMKEYFDIIIEIMEEHDLVAIDNFFKIPVYTNMGHFASAPDKILVSKNLAQNISLMALFFDGNSTHALGLFGLTDTKMINLKNYTQNQNSIKILVKLNECVTKYIQKQFDVKQLQSIRSFIEEEKLPRVQNALSTTLKQVEILKKQKENIKDELSKEAYSKQNGDYVSQIHLLPEAETIDFKLLNYYQVKESQKNHFKKLKLDEQTIEVSTAELTDEQFNVITSFNDEEPDEISDASEVEDDVAGLIEENNKTLPTFDDLFQNKNEENVTFERIFVHKIPLVAEAFILKRYNLEKNSFFRLRYDPIFKDFQRFFPDVVEQRNCTLGTLKDRIRSLKKSEYTILDAESNYHYTGAFIDQRVVKKEGEVDFDRVFPIYAMVELVIQFNRLGARNTLLSRILNAKFKTQRFNFRKVQYFIQRLYESGLIKLINNKYKFTEKFVRDTIINLDEPDENNLKISDVLDLDSIKSTNSILTLTELNKNLVLEFHGLPFFKSGSGSWLLPKSIIRTSKSLDISSSTTSNLNANFDTTSNIWSREEDIKFLQACGEVYKNEVLDLSLVQAKHFPHLTMAQLIRKIYSFTVDKTPLSFQEKSLIVKTISNYINSSPIEPKTIPQVIHSEIINNLEKKFSTHRNQDQTRYFWNYFGVKIFQYNKAK
ncbi:uncharacterized protein KGF55_005027 [Candida pseudojiufengensis]|uniref:uncharacterized protein n=1 Tax=Candida pseudojiufengensis TaxID=497109 RepID=UPI0022244324|nr:uncharacterized protein KGF55_005027 [Candida pseudojiufengensis]KAI5959795.1 hypothetical protein KGF55_005027 [Candida pseudojiufengensis]